MADFSRAAFRQGPVTVVSDGDEYLFPALTADRWLDILSGDRWAADILALADPAGSERFLDRALMGERTGAHLENLGHAVLAEVSGMEWWKAARLAGTVLVAPNLLSAVLLRGIDPGRVTLAAFLAVVRTLLLQSGTDLERAQRELELDAPPPDVSPEDLPPEEDMNAVVARMRNVPGMRTR